MNDSSGLARSPYVEGHTISLRVNSTDSFNAQILKVFTPFSFAAVMKIRLLHHLPRELFYLKDTVVILKVFDRRFAGTYGQHENKHYFDVARDSEYQDQLRMCPNINEYLLKNSSSVKTVHQIQNACRDMHSAEVKAYENLRDLQGEVVPYFFCSLRLAPRSALEDFADVMPWLEDYVAIPGILIEYIDGYQLSTIKQRMPFRHWNGICRAAVEAVNDISSYDVIHGDTRPDNIIVRFKNWVYSPVVIDFAHARLRKIVESDEEWELLKLLEHEDEVIMYSIKHHLGIDCRKSRS